MHYDVFNGDADGLCALVQLRLADPRASTLVTGVKRDIALLARVSAQAGDVVTVLDVSLDTNRSDVQRLLGAGARIQYVDHHFAGEIPEHANLQVTIDPAPDICTSLLVDRLLKGRFRPWAIAAAYGDNLGDVADRMAGEAGLEPAQASTLRDLGECLNYNAYGETVADLRFAPDVLFGQLMRHPDPFAFIAERDTFRVLLEGYRADMGLAAALRPERETATAAVYVLPDAAWSRRVSGVFANDLASKNRQRAHAILTAKADGGFLVSVRAPKTNPVGADILCLRFASGGGRKAAAGINHLPAADLERFVAEFGAAFGA
jgi:hypothetical protein